MARQISTHPLLGSVPAVHFEQEAAPRFAAWVLVAREMALNAAASGLKAVHGLSSGSDAAGRRPPPSAA